MSASLVRSDVTFERPVAEVEMKAHARSSIEVKDSCNCFKFCLPCFGKKVVKREKTLEAERRTIQAAQAALGPTPTFGLPRDDRLVRSPNMDALSHPHITVDVHIDTGEQ